MSRSIAIILFFSLLLCQTELRQVLRVPLLIEHFHEHASEQPRQDFFAFLALHYGAGSTAHHDEHDASLPFKADQCNVQSVVALEPPQHAVVGTGVPHDRTDLTRDYTLSVSQDPCSDIFQPPRA